MGYFDTREEPQLLLYHRRKEGQRLVGYPGTREVLRLLFHCGRKEGLVGYYDKGDCWVPQDEGGTKIVGALPEEGGAKVGWLPRDE